MSFNKTESARWQQESDKAIGELHTGVDKALAEAASRGFPAAPGVTLSTILQAGQAAKDKLTEVNGKIYEERRKVLFEQDEFAMKLVVSMAKLGMELYREELMNALALEQAENIALRDRGNADVISMNAEVDRRQVSIIQAKAEAERRVTVYKAQLVAAEAVTMTSERALITAQLATAEKKLEIIDSIYQVLAAEELVLEAENRRAATLDTLLAAELIVAGVKREMIPYYVEKASARQALAAAITAEIPITEAIVRLGYDRIALKTTEENAAHLEREAQEELELARAAWTRANKVTEFSRAQSRRLLQEYANIIQGEILANKKTLAEDGIDVRLTTALARSKIGIDDDVQVTTAEVGNTTTELAAITAGLEDRARIQAGTITASQNKTTLSHVTNNLQRQIIAGTMGG